MPKQKTVDHHSALIYAMVLVSAADRRMPDVELRSIGEIVKYLPVFRDYDANNLSKEAADCAALLGEDDGLEKVLALVKRELADKLRETAYAVACDVAASDGRVTPEEARALEMIRHRLEIGRLVAAAIERGARARHLTP